MSDKQRVARNGCNPQSNKCWNCNRQGHTRAQCPTVRCYYCGYLGHIRRDCTFFLDTQTDNSSQTFNPAGLDQTHQGRGTKM